jgi:hypothetical protein
MHCRWRLRNSSLVPSHRPGSCWQLPPRVPLPNSD